MLLVYENTRKSLLNKHMLLKSLIHSQRMMNLKKDIFGITNRPQFGLFNKVAFEQKICL